MTELDKLAVHRVLDCTIFTPEHNVFSGVVKSVTAPGEDGYLGILYNHAPLITALGKGELKVVMEDGTKHHWAVDGGFLEVLRNKVSVLTTNVEDLEKKRTSWVE